MKRQMIWFLCRIGGALLLALAFSAPARALDAGTPAPGFVLPASGGASIDLDDYRGKLVYLDFWASWCGPCRQSFPWMNAMVQRYADQGLIVIGVNVDKKQADADAFLLKLPAQFKIGYDPKGKLAEQYEVMGMPTSFLIGRDGKILAQHQSFHEKDAAAMEAQLRQALEAQP